MVKNSKITNLLNISKTRTNFEKGAADLDSAPEFTLQTAQVQNRVYLCYYLYR